MFKPLRRVLSLLIGVALLAGGLTASGGGLQQAGGQDPTSMSDAPAVVPPEQKAVDAALRIARTADRLAALEKIRKDYPKSTLLDYVDQQVLSAVLLMPDSTDAAEEVVDRMLARIPAEATADARFAATIVPVSQLLSKKILLDRAEKLLTAAAGSLDATSEHQPRSRYEMGRLAAAKGDTIKAEAEYRAAALAKHAPAVAALVNFHVERGEKDKAEGFLLDVVKTAPVNMAALSSLTNFYKNEPAKAERVLSDALSRDPMLPAAALSLARILQQRGDDKGALTNYMKAATMIYLRGADADAMRDLYTKANGNTTGLEAEINKLFVTLPKPMKPPAYTPTPQRTDRLVVLEMFTGSACPPCVAADLAFDAAIERYPADAVIPLAYHQHIPGPDPMTTSQTTARSGYYNVNGVPTMQVDGAMVATADGDNFGGGGRDRAPVVFDKYRGLIDAALNRGTNAALTVAATIAGDKVTATVDVTKLPANAGDLRLQIVLAERELLFGGENGIRHHPMVVRGTAGEKGLGLPLAGVSATKHTFDLAAIRADLTRSLAADIGRRRAGGSSNATFAAEDRAMTTIDPAHLVVVAFVQGPDRKILQAARAEVRR